MSKPSLPREKPTLEALLKFKRRERPDAAFWSEFDRSLNTRLTREFVSQQRRWDKRLWWVKFSAAFSLAASVAFAFLLMDAPLSYVQEGAPVRMPARPVLVAAQADMPLAVDVPPVPALAAAEQTQEAPAQAFAVVADVEPAPAPVLERAVLRETSFAALKERARPAQSALMASADQAEGYTKVWAKSALAEDELSARYVAGTTPAYAPLPGVSTHLSCAY